MNILCFQKQFKENPKLFVFYFCYIGILILLPPVSGTNPRSRLAFEASLCESLAKGKVDYSLNSVQESTLMPPWTIDWAKTPDGKIYSNKAPGPSFLALPLHCAFYWATSIGIPNAESRLANHRTYLYFLETLISFAYQMLPLIFFSYFFIKKNNSASSQQNLVFLTALFYGSTSSIYMNSWFGHGLPALLFLGSLFSFLNKKWFFFGLFLSWLHLSDYGSFYILLPIILIFIWDKDLSLNQKCKAVGWTVLASLPAAALWVHYHVQSFGGLLTLPQSFQNPIFVDKPELNGKIEAVMNIVPSPDSALQLIFGFKRGITFTQPWILGVIFFPLSFWSKLSSQIKKGYFFIVFSFVAMLVMNSSFGQWHGGSCVGPRYLASTLLGFSILLYWIFPNLNKVQRKFIYFTLGLSAALFALAFSTSVIPPPNALWPTLIEIGFSRIPTFILRLSLFLIFFLIGFFSLKKAKIHF